MYIEWSLVCLLPVRANKELVKDVLTCRPLESLMYKSCHPDDTDDPDVVSVSSEVEAEGMEDILGVSSRLNKPPPAGPSAPEPPAPEEEGMIKVPKKDLKKAQGILKDILLEGKFVPLELHGKMSPLKSLRCRQVTPIVSCAIRASRALAHYATT